MAVSVRTFSVDVAKHGCGLDYVFCHRIVFGVRNVSGRVRQVESVVCVVCIRGRKEVGAVSGSLKVRKGVVSGLGGVAPWVCVGPCL